MEYCMEARALKSSLLSETATQEVIGDDMWCLAGINNSDDFSVDDLLDFSDKDFNESFIEDSEQQKDSLSISSHKREFNDDGDKFSNSLVSPGSGDLGPLTAGELPVPVDEMENLEWLSQFVDDSVSGISFSWLTGNFTGRTGKCDMDRSKPEAKKFTVLDLPKPIRTKPRKKRSRRPSGNIWSLGLILLTESLSSSLYSSQDSCITPPFMSYSNPVQVIDSFDECQKPPPTKKQKKNGGEPGSLLGGSNFLRTCTHCLVQKTPQWRTGPLGPKTLCNACGVRFKSGRLFPEYRPACSPTFTGDIHSNSHRKVLEMRRRKEAVEHAMSGLAPSVQTIKVS